MLRELKPALLVVVVTTAVTGILYPLAVTGAGQALFPRQAGGSLVEKDGQVIGSSLIAQGFTRPEYLHPRPSAAGKDGYDAAASSGSNLGPSSQALVDAAKARQQALKAENPNARGPVPVELVTTSGSGLDPHLSPAAALWQVPRIAKARGVGEKQVETVIRTMTEGRDMGLLGEPRVNVLEVNLALDRNFPPPR